MLVSDSNLLIYAYSVNSPYHEAAADWWEAVLNGKEAVGLPWSVVVGFIRIVSDKRLHPNAPPLEKCFEVVNKWLAYPHVSIITPGTSHLAYVQDLMKESGAKPEMINDAHIAALAIEYRATIHTHDRDFRRFSGVRLHDPLTD